MAYVLNDDQKPMSGVDVHIVTESGFKGVAKYWDVTGAWLTCDKAINIDDRVKKWKYEDAKIKQ